MRRNANLRFPAFPSVSLRFPRGKRTRFPRFPRPYRGQGNGETCCDTAVDRSFLAGRFPRRETLGRRGGKSGRFGLGTVRGGPTRLAGLLGALVPFPTPFGPDRVLRRFWPVPRRAFPSLQGNGASSRVAVAAVSS